MCFIKVLGKKMKCLNCQILNEIKGRRSSSYHVCIIPIKKRLIFLVQNQILPWTQGLTLFFLTEESSLVLCCCKPTADWSMELFHFTLFFLHRMYFSESLSTCSLVDGSECIHGQQFDFLPGSSLPRAGQGAAQTVADCCLCILHMLRTKEWIKAARESRFPFLVL